MSELPNSFIPPLAKAIHDFPVPADSWQYSREFDGANLTDFLEVAWDESQFARYREYCKKHDLVIELHGDTHENYFGKTVVVTDVNQPKPLEMGFTNRLVLIVKTKPKALYAKPLPPKRPVELRTAKSEYQRSAEVLRTRYVNDLLQMLKKADLAKDDLAENTVKRELKSLVLPKDSDAKELTKLLLGKWRSDGKSDNRWGPIFRREGVWNSGSEENKNESAPWHVEGNELVETYPKREDSDEITTRRFPIILLNKTQFVYLEETEFKDEIWRSVVSWERIPEAKRR